MRPDGKKEIIDFRLAGSESAAEWERFLTDLYRRGLTGEGLEMICVDGGAGLLAALPTVFPGTAVQRCWAHKIRNVLDKVKKADQPAVKRALHKIMNASNAPAARAAARKFANRFEDKYPAAVACLRNDLDELLTCFRYKSEEQRRKATNHKRYRKTIPRSTTTDPANGNFPRQDIHGPHPVRRLHPRKQVTGRQHPFPADTEQLTLPSCHRARVAPGPAPNNILVAAHAR